ncbi:MAG: hypothetical protein JWN89_448 [Parcubacteria group bacterium]|nr:hypothetical protein [Parcubacteria group bacterium]
MCAQKLLFLQPETLMQQFGYEDDEKMHARFFRLLSDPDLEDEQDETMYDVMSQIQDLLNACYWLGINPLEELKRILPQYAWNYLRSKDLDLIRAEVAKSDLIWRVNWTEDGFKGIGVRAEEIQLVTAQLIGSFKVLEHLFFAGWQETAEESTPKLDFVRELGGEPISSYYVNT